jgi:hypothetical protein
MRYGMSGGYAVRSVVTGTWYPAGTMDEHKSCVGVSRG